MSKRTASPICVVIPFLFGSILGMFVLFNYGLNPLLTPDQQLIGLFAAFTIFVIFFGGTITIAARGVKVTVTGGRAG